MQQSTYRSLALVTFCITDWVVVLRYVQMQEVLVREVLLALGAAVHVRLLVMDVVRLE